MLEQELFFLMASYQAWTNEYFTVGEFLHFKSTCYV